VGGVLRTEDIKNPLSLAYGLLILFTGLLFLRPQEISSYFQGIALLQITGVGLVVAVFVNHRHLEWDRFRNRILPWVCLYLVAVLLSIPLSLWPGGSVKYVREILLKEIVIATVLIVVIYRSKDLRGMILAIGLSSTILAIITLIYFAKGEFLVGGDRAALSGGVLSDPNDLAACFVFSLPFLYFGGLKISRRKLFFGCAMALLTVGVLITRSRGGMLGLMAVFFMGWVLDVGKRGRNFFILIGAAVLIAILFPTTVERLGTIADFEKDRVGSIQARVTTLKSGIGFFFDNFFLGVGVGCFEIAEGATHGNVGKWNAAHNMWIEVAAETGVLGFVGFAGCVFAILRSLVRVRKKSLDDAKVKNMAEALLCSTVGFLVCGTFLSHAGSWNLFYLIGLTVALENLFMKNRRKSDEEGMRRGKEQTNRQMA
jgi:O-antigen ligase